MFEGSIDRLEAIPGRLEDAYDGFVARVEATWDLVAALLPAGGELITWYVKQKMEEIREYCNRILERVRGALDRYRSVLRLFEVSYLWTREVLGPVSEVRDALPDAEDFNLDHWQDDARPRYDTIVGEQQGALGDYAQRASFISGWLEDVAGENVDYLLALLETVAEVISTLVQAAVEAASAVGAAEAISSISGLVGDLVTAGIERLGQIGRRVSQILSNVGELERNAYSHLPGGNWPPAVKRA
jgi:hypothetical protein